jgi:hypothetical protein
MTITVLCVMVKRPSFREENFRFRSKEEHERDLEDLASPSDMVRGVKQDSVLNFPDLFIQR